MFLSGPQHPVSLTNKMDKFTGFVIQGLCIEQAKIQADGVMVLHGIVVRSN